VGREVGGDLGAQKGPRPATPAARRLRRKNVTQGEGAVHAAEPGSPSPRLSPTEFHGQKSVLVFVFWLGVYMFMPPGMPLTRVCPVKGSSSEVPGVMSITE
jgi:hypothetical protein